jgi:hypothetical protein
MTQARIALSRGTVKLELEGEQGFVESHLEKLLPLVRDLKGSGAAGDDLQDPEETKGGDGRQTLKSFIKAKAPANAYEAMAAVLVYKQQHESKPELSAKDIVDAMIQGGHRPPDRVPQALSDCRRKYGYIEPGTKKGLWRVSQQGQTLVEIDMPKTKSS